jgi:hypothetical protein
MGEEIVPYKQGEENKVIDDPLQRVLECQRLTEWRRRRVRELQIEILSQEGKVEEVEVGRLDGFRFGFLPSWTEFDFLSEEAEVGVVGEETEHDEVGIEAVETVSYVGVIARLSPLPPNVVHNLVFALARHLVPAQYHRHIPPVCVLGDLLVDKVLELCAESGHERCAGGNAVGIESFLVRQFLPFRLGLLSRLSGFFCCAEPSTALLVHLCTGSDAVDGHIEHLLGLDLPKQVVHVREDGREDLLLRQPEVGIVVVRVGAVVDDAVEVEVEVVEFGDGLLGDQLGRQGVPL